MTDRDTSDEREDITAGDPSEHENASPDNATIDELEEIQSTEVEDVVPESLDGEVVDADGQLPVDDVEPVEIDAPDGGVNSTEWARSTGAFVLGALDPADTAAAAHAFADSPGAQAELIALLPVADILTSLYQSQPSGSLVPQRASAQAASESTQAVAAPEKARVTREGKPPRAAASPVAVPAGTGRTSSMVGMGALGLLAALGILWALAQRDQISTRDQEIQALRTQVADLAQGTNASVFVLNPASDDAPDARATVFYSPGDGTVLIDARGLPELDADQVYQVWLQATGDETWQPGPTFLVNDAGEAVRRLAGETPGFARMAVSQEPSPGSTQPTGSFLMEGELVRTDG